MDKSPIVLRPATKDDLRVVISWIADADACKRWAGPVVTFPMTIESVARQIEFNPDNTYVLEENGEPVCCGQLIRKSNERGHAARVIVAPKSRGRGMGRRFCQALIQQALFLKFRRISLNVYKDNTPAIQLYQNLGFRETVGPKNIAISNDIIYMEINIIGK